MTTSIDRIATSIRGSQTLRLLSVAFLALLLQIPVAMISGLVSERQQRRDAAIEEVSSKWGNAQSITGPALVIPYSHRTTETTAAGQQVFHTETRNAIFLPDRLRIRETLDSEVRTRGIFSVPVYRMGLVMEGEFSRPRFSELGIDPATVAWGRAHLAVGISDARAIQDAAVLSWNGQPVAFLPGTGGFAEAGTGIHAPVGTSDGMGPVSFSFPLSLNGSLATDVVPFGQTTTVDIRGDHGNPSFQGNWLPATRTVTDDAFEAQWSIPFLGRSYPQAWTSQEEMQQAIGTSRFGVALIDPVDHYRMAARSVKYAGLFIVLTFATLWLMEILTGMRVHPIQYLMLGGALCLFYLLELSLSEHLGFPFAYVLASAAVVAMVGAYSRVILRRVDYALIVGAGVAALYGYLYLLLMNEDYSLLIGSVGLFAILGGIMFVTRRVDWYATGPRAAESSIR
jgi:inner membrane protein